MKKLKCFFIHKELYHSLIICQVGFKKNLISTKLRRTKSVILFIDRTQNFDTINIFLIPVKIKEKNIL